ncbi:ras-related protein Rab-4B isoform X1 [Equus caballus]|uniref:ras-related protein Rab-4B isoform X1 n=1 Tax=Equus caballus TaxID=9796 RepID=UPI0038B33CE9
MSKTQIAEQRFSWQIICKGRRRLTCVYPPPIFILLAFEVRNRVRQLKILSSSRLCQSCPWPLLCIRIPAPVCSYPIRSRTPDQIRFSARRSILCTAPSHFLRQSLALVPPLSARPLSHRQSAPFVPPPGRRVPQSLPWRSVAQYPATLAGRAGGGWRRKWRRRAPGVGRSPGCSRSGAAASRGAGAAAAPYCGPQRPRPSHGRDLRQTGLQPHDRRGVWIPGGQRGWEDCEAADLGHSWPGAISRGAVSGQTPASGVTGSPWPHRSVTRSYYRGAAGALLVYDITSRETYNSLAAWLTDARTLASPNIVVILCGNKKDLDPEREVTFLEASRFAQENELMFLETSALTGENVEEAFLKCARTILNKIDSGELDPERMGSGIQYGDASLRQLRQPRSAQAVAPQPCGC